MVTFTRFLLLNLHLLSRVVYANEDSSSDALKLIEAERSIQWLEEGRSVLVHVATPDLTFRTSILKLLTRLAVIPSSLLPPRSNTNPKCLKRERARPDHHEPTWWIHLELYAYPR